MEKNKKIKKKKGNFLLLITLGYLPALDMAWEKLAEGLEISQTWDIGRQDYEGRRNLRRLPCEKVWSMVKYSAPQTAKLLGKKTKINSRKLLKDKTEFGT